MFQLMALMFSSHKRGNPLPGALYAGTKMSEFGEIIDKITQKQVALSRAYKIETVSMLS